MKTLKKTLCLVLVLAMSVSMFAVAASAASYDKYADAEAVADSRYVEAMDVAMGLGIINGVEGNKVAIDNTLNRAMAAKILCYVMLGKDTAEALAAGNTIFSDVAVDHWANKYIAYAASQNILVGSNGKFNPGKEVTGYQLGKMLLNAMGYGLDPVPVLVDGVFTTKIVNKYEGTYWTTFVSKDANDIGLFAGLAGLNLNKALTRGQAMQMAFNAIKIDGGDELDYAVVKSTASTTDAYGRTGYKWVIDADVDGVLDAGETTAVSGNYNVAADWTYTADGSATANQAAIKAAYAKFAGIEADKVAGVADETVAAGFIREYTVTVGADGTHTLSEIATYRYILAEVATVATTAQTTGAHKGAYLVTMKDSSTCYTDDLTVSVKAKDILMIPKTDDNTVVWADAVIATPVTAKVTSIGSNYVVVNGAKLYAAATEQNASITNGLALASVTSFTSTYNFFVSPAGTALASTVVAAASTSTDAGIFYATLKYSTSAGVDAYGVSKGTNYFIQGVDGTGKEVNYQVTKTEYDSVTTMNALYTVATSYDTTLKVTVADLTVASTAGTKGYGVLSTATVAATASKIAENYYYTSGVKFIYVSGSGSTLKVTVKDGKQALASANGYYYGTKVGQTANYDVEYVFITGAYTESTTVSSTDIVYAIESSASTVKVPYTDATGAVLTGFEHVVYINGVKTTVVTASSDAISGFKTYTKDTVTGLYTFSNYTTGVYTGKTFTNVYGDLVTTDSHTDVSAAGAKIVDLRTTTTPVTTLAGILAGNHTISYVTATSGTATIITTIYITA